MCLSWRGRVCGQVQYIRVREVCRDDERGLKRDVGARRVLFVGFVRTSGDAFVEPSSVV